MYSILMVMALNTGAAATPAWDGCYGGGCWGGCHGGYVSSCAGCWGGCNGCSGGHRLFGGLFNKHRGCNGCNGCWGSCSGYNGGCSGCWGGCNGGHVVSYGCTGCNGSWGCDGCSGRRHRLFGGLFHKNRCNGCDGCWGGCNGGCYVSACHGCHGHMMGCTGCSGAPVQSAPAQGETAPKAGEKSGSGKSASMSQAEVLVSLPTEAKLFIDGQATVSTSNTRKFVSPELVAGKEYFYTLRAEVVRDGQTVSLTKEVTVRAGETVQASFEFPAQVAAK